MTVNEVYQAYQSGVDSSTVAGREVSFNKALQLMHQLDSESGELFYDIGNSYYQLEQYPWALFYYLKAQKELPRDREVQQNISATQQKLELPVETHQPWIPLSVSEELLIAQLLILMTTLFLSFRIWFKDRFLMPFSDVLLGITLVFLLFIGGQYYLTPIQGVLAQAAILYKQPESQSDRVFLDPLPPGTVLQIIGESEQGEWIKVTNEKGVVGYVQANKLLL